MASGHFLHIRSFLDGKINQMGALPASHLGIPGPRSVETLLLMLHPTKKPYKNVLYESL
jgi:hypothetical protein